LGLFNFRKVFDKLNYFLIIVLIFYIPNNLFIVTSLPFIKVPKLTCASKVYY